MYFAAHSMTRLIVFLAFFLFPLGQLIVQKYGAPVSPHSPFFLCLAIIAVAGVIRAGSLPKPNMPVTIYAVGLLFALSMAPFSENTISVLISLLRQGELLLPYFVLLCLGRRTPVAVTALKGFLAGNVTACIYALTLFFTGEVYYAGRLTYSEGYNPTAFGANIAAAFVLMPLIAARQRGGYITLLMLAIALVLIVSLILSQSRNAMISLTLGVMAILAFTAAKKIPIQAGRIRGGRPMLRKLSVIAVMLGSLFIATLLLFRFGDIDPRYFSRLLALLEFSDSGAATAGRDSIWRMYLELSVPLGGFGFDNTESFVSLVGLQHFPHNSFLLIYMQGGFVLLSLYLLFSIFMVIDARPRVGVLVPISMASAYLFFLNFGNDVYQYPYFWIPFAIVMEFVRQARRKPELDIRLGQPRTLGVSA